MSLNANQDPLCNRCNHGSAAIHKESLEEDYTRFRARFDSAMLTTIGVNGKADSAYENYLRHDDVYYFYASEFATHTQNMIASSRVTLMFIEYAASGQIKPDCRRIVLKSTVEIVSPVTGEFSRILTAYQARFRDFPSKLLHSPEFHLFRVTPQEGCFVRAFGEAWPLQRERIVAPTETRRPITQAIQNQTATEPKKDRECRRGLVGNPRKALSILSRRRD